ncbi:MAG: hypothetical protein NC037_03780 [Bacteroides sp.]|nr:hypothetical protein [Bacillota bacterium]MCM1394218.1 hypothetical protein [[Eubacterium] siraeum]MCM1455630.1 hypothetical protein [Bacteroides sp.]
MDNFRDVTFIASDIAQSINRLCPLDCNIAAMLTAQLLADGKSKIELKNLCHFISLIQSALKTYLEC